MTYRRMFGQLTARSPFGGAMKPAPVLKENFIFSPAGLLRFLALACLAPAALCQSVSLARETVERILRSVVLVKGTDGSGTALGSGFRLTSDGKVATNLHVIRDMKSGGGQLQSGEIFDSFTVLAYDEPKDLAVIRIAGFDLPTLELSNSNSLQPGEPVMAFGSPRGLQGTITAGIVSSTRYDVPNIRAHAGPLIARLQNELPPLGYAPITPKGTESSIATFLCKDAEAVRRKIRASKAKILLTGPNSALTVGRFGNHLRFSVSVFNNDQDIDTILEVLA